MSAAELTRFKPRTALKSYRFFYFSFSLFFIIGLLFLIGFFNDTGFVYSVISLKDFTPQENIGLLTVCFSFLVLIFLFSKGFGVGFYYEISCNGIRIKTALSNNTVPFDQILKVEKLTEDEAKKLVTDQNYSDFIKFIKFASVPVIVNRAKRESAVKISLSGDFILITTRDQGKFLLSPKEVDKFLTIANNYSGR